MKKLLITSLMLLGFMTHGFTQAVKVPNESGGHPFWLWSGGTSDADSHMRIGTDYGHYGDAAMEIYQNYPGGNLQRPGKVIINGQLGVGTANPQAGLDVRANNGTIIGNRLYFYGSGLAADGWPSARLVENWGIRFDSPDPKWVLSSGPSVVIGYQPAGQSWGSGSLFVQENVGIGTTSPQARLDVAGDMKAQGNLGVGGKLNISGRTLMRDGLDLGDLAADGYGSRGMITWGENGFVIFARAGQNLNLGANGRQQDFFIGTNGNVGIGTAKPDSKLAVAGRVHAQEVKVSVAAGADFVFEEDYALPSLEETARFVKENKHLPGIAPAKEMEAEGLDLGEMNIKLLQKVEELTLHLLNISEEVKNLKQENKELKSLLLK